MPFSLGNLVVRGILNSPLHSLLGDTFAVITVRGRRSGREISTPINIDRDGDSYTVLSMRSRTWWRNLRGGQPARLRVSGATFEVEGEVIEAQDRVAEALTAYLRRRPSHARYLGLPNPAKAVLLHEQIEKIARDRVVIRLQRRAAP